MHYQCSHEKVSASEASTKRWCCTNSDCDTKLEWGFCPETKAPLKSDCVKEGYSSLDGGQNCYKHFVDEVIHLKSIAYFLFYPVQLAQLSIIHFGKEKNLARG